MREFIAASNWIDYGIVALVALSIIMGAIRGFVREAMSLVTWMAALIIGILYCEPVSLWFSAVSIEGVRYLLAFVLLALTTLIIGGVLGYFIGHLIKITGFTTTDRLTGVLFGFARGVVVVAIAVLLAEATPLAHAPLWKESQLIPNVQPVTLWLRTHFPTDIAKKLQFSAFMDDTAPQKPKVSQ